jgi:uncharacterized protein
LPPPHNPISEPLTPDQAPAQFGGHPLPAPPRPAEDPPWSGWDVVALFVLTFVAMVLCIFLTGYATRLYFAPHASVMAVLLRPEVIVIGQLLAYMIILLLMYKLVRNHTDVPVREAIRWNWPRNWTTYLLAGLGLEICLLPFAYLLPMPKNLPMDEFFKTAHDAYVLSIFGILFAPLFEELFFRGFLYPVLARRLGMGASIVLTTIFFALVHGQQLGFSWGPVLVIFLVGLVLTIVRAVKKSVAATVLMHMAYNSTIFIVAYIATDGFRHMEKFNQ